MKTPHKILVATDLSPASLPASKYAYGLASALQATVRLVSVLDPTPFFPLSDLAPAAEMWRDLVSEQEAALGEKLTALAEKHFPGGHVASTVLKDASPARAIAELVKEGNYDLVVVGSHGRTGVGRMLLGSVAEKIVRLCPCPTLVVPSASRE